MAGQREVTFFAPAIGQSIVPFGLTGEGTLSWNHEALSLTGPVHRKGATSVFGCFGFLASFALGIVLMTALERSAGLDLDDRAGLLGLAIAVAGTVASIRLGRLLFKPKVRTLVIPWTSLASLDVDGSLVRVISTGKPKGSLWFALGSHSAPPEGVEAAESSEALGQFVADLKRRR
jgi:hypothetical protein